MCCHILDVFFLAWQHISGQIYCTTTESPRKWHLSLARLINFQYHDDWGWIDNRAIPHVGWFSMGIDIVCIYLIYSSGDCRRISVNLSVPLFLIDSIFVNWNSLHVSTLSEIIVDCIVMSCAVVPDTHGISSPAITTGKFRSAAVCPQFFK